jgi:DNA-directed RNA polymerase subunit RPC12/RpoP
MSFAEGYVTTGVVCSLCSKAFTVPQDAELPDPFEVRCPHCGRLQTRRLVILLSRKSLRPYGSFLLPGRGCCLVAVEIPTWGERGCGSSRWERHARTLSNVCG